MNRYKKIQIKVRFISVPKDRKIELKLRSILAPYDDWSDTNYDERNENAKSAPHSFYTKFKKLKPNMKISNLALRPSIDSFAPIRKALQEKNYTRTCNEVISFLHYDPFLYAPIHDKLVRLLEEFKLKEGEPN